MSEPSVAFVDATKEWRRRGRVVRALDGLTWSTPGPGVHGLIGPNGAGKTTAMRALVGHQFLTAGTARLFGATTPGELHEALRRTGVMVETPRFLPHLTATRTLEILALAGSLPRRRVHEVLERTGLGARADERVGGYSLGMRQRLGLAAAMLKDPELLVLDEPANGLDPSGIRDLRRFLRRCGDEGRTVLVSSHLLGELAQVCDTCTIIVSGSLRWTGTLRELEGSSRYLVRVRGRTADAARRIAEAGWPVVHDVPSGVDGGLGEHGWGAGPTASVRLVVTIDPAEVWRLSAMLAAAGLHVVELTPRPDDLEALYSTIAGSEGSQDAFGEVGGRVACP